MYHKWLQNASFPPKPYHMQMQHFSLCQSSSNSFHISENMRLLGMKEKRREKKKEVWVEPKEKRGKKDRKLVNSGTLFYVGLYFVLQKRCSLWSCINNQEDYWHISRSGNCQYIVTSLRTAMRMPTNKSQASWAKQRGSDANPGASGNHLWHSLCSFSCFLPRRLEVGWERKKGGKIILLLILGQI